MNAFSSSGSGGKMPRLDCPVLRTSPSEDILQGLLEEIDSGENIELPNIRPMPNKRLENFGNQQSIERNLKMQTPHFTPNKNPNRRISSSRSTSVTPRPHVPFCIVALVEGRGTAKGEIGLAAVDVKNPVLMLSQFADTQTYVRVLTELNILSPVEVIMPSTFGDTAPRTKLFQQVHEMFPETSIVTVQRKYFNENKGLQYIRYLCVPEYKTVEMEVNCKYYCLAAAAALIKYVEFILNILFAPLTLKVVFRGSTNTVMIDSTTACHLELVANAVNHRNEKSLLAVMQYTHTPGGNRLLRANILQPPSDLNTINTRLDCIAELIDQEEFFYNLKSVIGRFVDIEPLLSLCIQIPKEENIRTAEQKITNVISLKHILDLVNPLRCALRPGENVLFKTFYEALCDPRFDILKELVGHVIHSDTRCQKGALNMRMQKCFAVKANINGLLDIARRTYTEIVNDIVDLTKQLGEQHNLSLSTGYNAKRGFFLQVASSGRSVGSEPVLPPTFIKVVKTRSTISFTTEDLIKLNDRVKESVNEIYLMSNAVITELLDEVRERVQCLHALTEAVATLDFLLSLAHYSTLSLHVRPSFCDTLAIKSGRHPILEKIKGEGVTPNNTFMSDENNFLIITGPNMSGKTTYLKQVAILQIMAQMGSFVPAEFATFRIIDQIFSRMGYRDDTEKNCSTFMLQIKEINYVLQNATDSSLIIIDELAKGSNDEETVGLIFAISEEILLTKAFTLHATHVKELTQLENMYPNAANYHFQLEHIPIEDGKSYALNFTHELKRGQSVDVHYGIQLAEISSMPSAVVDYAKQLVTEWEEPMKDIPEALTDVQKNRESIQLVAHLLQVARNSLLGEADLREHLRCLQDQFRDSLSESDSEETPNAQNEFPTDI